MTDRTVLPAFSRLNHRWNKPYLPLLSICRGSSDLGLRLVLSSYHGKGMRLSWVGQNKASKHTTTTHSNEVNGFVLW